MNELLEIDLHLLLWIQEHRIVALDRVMYWISFVTTFVTIATLLVMIYFGWVKHNAKLKLVFWQLLTTFLSAALIAGIIKSIVKRVRPFADHPEILKLSEAGSYSFPSGHTTEAFSVAIAICLLFPKQKWTTLFLLWAVLIGYTRMVLGVHYPLDVLGGIILAIMLNYVVHRIFRIFYKEDVTQ